MNTSLSQPPVIRRRRVWPWIVGLLLAPFLIVAVGAASYLTLDRDAALLRRHLMAAAPGDWETKVQLSIGSATLGTLRTGLWFVDHPEIGEARCALRAVKHASVGVYERTTDAAPLTPGELLAGTDRAMQQRGWSRMVGVAGTDETVMIYTSDTQADDEPVELRIAVLDGRELVVVSTAVDAGALQELVARHVGDKVDARLRQLARR